MNVVYVMHASLISWIGIHTHTHTVGVNLPTVRMSC